MSHMHQLTSKNTNAVAHRIARDTLVYECPNCEFGEVPVSALVESERAACLDCGARYELLIRPVEEDSSP